MNFKFISLSSLLLFLSALIFAGCGSTRVVTKTTLPARIKAMQQKQKVKVDLFGGQYGDDARRALRSAVSQSHFHTLVDSGADTLISGEVLDSDYTSELSKSKTKKCVARTKKGKCTKRVTIFVYSRAEDCTAKIALSVRSTGGQVLYEGTVEGFALDTVNKKGAEPPKRVNELCKQARAKAMRHLGHFVNPHEIMVRLYFRDVDDGGVTESAVKLAERSAFKRAMKILAQQVGMQQDPELRAWTHYNLATVLSAMGQFQQCTDELFHAREVLGSDSDITRLLNHCKGYVL